MKIALKNMAKFLALDIQLRVDLGISDNEIYAKIEKLHSELEDEIDEPLHISGEELSQLYDTVTLLLSLAGYVVNPETSCVFKAPEGYF